MKRALKIRQSIAAIILLVAVATTLLTHPDLYQPVVAPATPVVQNAAGEAATALGQLEIKGRAPKTNYSRDQFGDGWTSKLGCDTRNIILHRDLVDVVVNTECKVISGILHDPYRGKDIQFVRGDTTSDDVQIDHVVALSDAWQTGAQQLTHEERVNLANDPLELLAVDGPANQQKSDGDAATWLPSNKVFRCQYIARQIAVKQKYHLWVKAAEKDVMVRVLVTCPGQKLPTS
jgi:uncharacterized protein DUF1524